MYEAYKNLLVQVYTTSQNQPIYWGILTQVGSQSITLNPGLYSGDFSEYIEEEDSSSLEDSSSSLSKTDILKKNGSPLEIAIDKIIAVQDMSKIRLE
jgi:hypothetical protein